MSVLSTFERNAFERNAYWELNEISLFSFVKLPKIRIDEVFLFISFQPILLKEKKFPHLYRAINESNRS